MKKIIKIQEFKIIQKKIRYPILYAFILLFITTINSAQYKLEVGNFWIYSYDYTEERISIIDTLTLFDSLLYYETQLMTYSKYNALTPDSRQHYWRKKSDGFFENLSIYHDTKDTVITEDVFYKDNAQLGDKWIYGIKFYEDSTVVDTSWSEVVDVFEGFQFGGWRTIKKVRYYSNHPQVPLDFYKYFCDDFGELSEGNYLGIVSSLKGCYIDGLAYGDTSFGVVSVADDSFPSEFRLSQNYPNPFNPNTIINYSIPKASAVKLIVYDVKAEEVSVLLDEFQSAGNYKVNFDASKFNLSSGIYFYRLISDNFNQTKKMIYLR